MVICGNHDDDPFAIFPHSYCYRRPAFFAVCFTAFFAAFLARVFLAAGVFATAFLLVFFVTAFATFFAAFLAGVFFAGAFFRTFVTEVTAASNAVLMDPATSDAIAIPYPTVSP